MLLDNVTRCGLTLGERGEKLSDPAEVTHMMRTPFRRGRDPWWDMDGRTVRNSRRRRLAVSFAILGVAATLLVTVGAIVPVRARPTTLSITPPPPDVLAMVVVAVVAVAMVATLASVGQTLRSRLRPRSQPRRRP